VLSGSRSSGASVLARLRRTGRVRRAGRKLILGLTKDTIIPEQEVIQSLPIRKGKFEPRQVRLVELHPRIRVSVTTIGRVLRVLGVDNLMPNDRLDIVTQVKKSTGDFRYLKEDMVNFAVIRAARIIVRQRLATLSRYARDEATREENRQRMGEILENQRPRPTWEEKTEFSSKKEFEKSYNAWYEKKYVLGVANVGPAPVYREPPRLEKQRMARVSRERAAYIEEVRTVHATFGAVKCSNCGRERMARVARCSKCGSTKTRQ